MGLCRGNDVRLNHQRSSSSSFQALHICLRFLNMCIQNHFVGKVYVFECNCLLLFHQLHLDLRFMNHKG